MSRACRSEPLHSARLRDHGIMTCASIRRCSNVVKLAIEGGGGTMREFREPRLQLLRHFLFRPQQGHGRYAVIVALLPMSTGTCLATETLRRSERGLEPSPPILSAWILTPATRYHPWGRNITGTLPILNHYISERFPAVKHCTQQS